ncbi:MAG: phytoene desaturase family protein [Calditrichia bacterium]
MSRKIAIVGGGLGGLSAAIHLAAGGYIVSLFEKNERYGGKMNLHEEAGYRFDTGPSLLTLPHVIDDLFTTAGIDRQAIMQIDAVDPICRYFWSDGSRMDAKSESRAMEAEMAQISPADAKRYNSYLSYCETIYNITANIFLYNPVHEFHTLLNKETLHSLMRIAKIDPFRNVNSSVSRFFEDERLQQLFNRYATYNGSDPFQAPATLNIIPYVEFGLGGYYIRGGMYQLVECMVAAAKKLNVTLHNNTSVEKIVHKDGRVRAIKVDGETIAADAVVCNADVVEAHNMLIDGFPSQRKKLNKLEASISGMVFMWGVKKQNAQLCHHNILFSEDYRNEFRQIFSKRIVPDDPTVYVAITSRSDASHAPADCENWFVLLNMPYLNGQDWQAAVPRMKQAVLRRLKQSGIDISTAIEMEKVLTPEDFYRNYGSNRGSIYGISSNSRITAFKRPANRSRAIDGLFFAGGSSHPGGGIPLVILSGKMCADLIKERVPLSKAVYLTS